MTLGYNEQNDPKGDGSVTFNPTLLGNYDRPTDRQTNRLTNGHKGS